MTPWFRKSSTTGTRLISSIGRSRICSASGRSILSLSTTISNRRSLRRSWKRTRFKFRKQSTQSDRCRSLTASTKGIKETPKLTNLSNSNSSIGSTDRRALTYRR